MEDPEFKAKYHQNKGENYQRSNMTKFPDIDGKHEFSN
jgi:hypothetical protein